MPGFERPAFTYNYNPDTQIKALRTHRDTTPGRAIPTRTPGRLLVASWNITNLGVHQRRDRDHRLIAEMLSWFDLIAVQEVNDNLTGQVLRDEYPDSCARVCRAAYETRYGEPLRAGCAAIL